MENAGPEIVDFFNFPFPLFGVWILKNVNWEKAVHIYAEFCEHGLSSFLMLDLSWSIVWWAFLSVLGCFWQLILEMFSFGPVWLLVVQFLSFCRPTGCQPYLGDIGFSAGSLGSMFLASLYIFQTGWVLLGEWWCRIWWRCHEYGPRGTNATVAQNPELKKHNGGPV